jgi:hypothetical protein
MHVVNPGPLTMTGSQIHQKSQHRLHDNRHERLILRLELMKPMISRHHADISNLYVGKMGVAPVFGVTVAAFSRSRLRIRPKVSEDRASGGISMTHNASILHGLRLHGKRDMHCMHLQCPHGMAPQHFPSSALSARAERLSPSQWQSCKSRDQCGDNTALERTQTGSCILLFSLTYFKSGVIPLDMNKG